MQELIPFDAAQIRKASYLNSAFAEVVCEMRGGTHLREIHPRRITPAQIFCSECPFYANNLVQISDAKRLDEISPASGASDAEAA